MSERLNGKVAIVTGSGRGIGFGIAKKLAEEGATVMISDVNEETAKAAVQSLKEMGATTDYILCNVADWDQTQKLIAGTIERFGKLDILVNNAGINKDRTLKKMTKEEWDAVVAVNLTGMFYTMSPAIQHMISREYGRIINISSASYLNGNIGQANYAAAKAGVIALTRTAGKELGRYHITCNAIVPGFIKTEMTANVPDKVKEIMIGKLSLGEMGTPEDVGNMVAFLASDDAAHMTQGIYNVDGGMVL
ncbi:MAG: 3-oxoacyl-ACP reductase FabG [Phoenicibacter congonensis]|uniref:3-oxoacyl-ACP reductase FabG n=1 Tax=Phoenicibacter congonensis TaxID=1944646 RepID=A0AA43U9I7_9ACTN|nr:3-oxoacyl-ACP reductase FabG [Phoenicibacter congonensis]